MMLLKLSMPSDQLVVDARFDNVLHFFAAQPLGRLKDPFEGRRDEMDVKLAGVAQDALVDNHAVDDAVAVIGFADGPAGGEIEAGEVKRGGDFRIDIQPADEAWAFETRAACGPESRRCC